MPSVKSSSPKGNRGYEETVQTSHEQGQENASLVNQDLLGKVLKKQDLAEHYGVNSKSVQRDIDSIRGFLADQTAQ